ncbi:DAHP synthetase [Sphaerosporella brunnea]|uniref:Phospho-2-dehydro-3-deoxyheptonate aldolase n=1 Tax=Sphaerosporella brunnea TaxID=1250544 RepID=A0A5J5F891_9PEZI|nr:DAHP synthetase [Sphaerosporella brunnea]
MSSPPVQLPLSDGAKSAAARTTSSDPSSPPAVSSGEWSPTSWQSKPMRQSVKYNDVRVAERALQKLESLPPLVTPVEIQRLRASLKEVALGNAFLLQGGDCAELFDYCTAQQIDAKMKLLLQMSLVLIWGGNIPVVRIARMAGQFAKPRSSLTEKLEDGREVPSFRGDNINGYPIEERTPDPKRLVDAYFHSAATLNYVRSQLSSGFADLHHPFEWTLAHVQDDESKERYQSIVDSITDAIRFMRTIGADTSSSLGSVDLYTSHEGMLLEYEQSLTRHLKDPTTGQLKWYNTSAHFIWIGDRTRQLDGAHVEYFRGIENPIGIKVGPSMEDAELVRLLDIVNPNKEIGKITLITRYGCDKVAGKLPGHIKAVAESGHVVVWQCDPMHGNTRSSEAGVKTRQFGSIISELSTAIRVHKELGSRLGGVHLELTGENVTECVGGSQGLTDKDLSLNYTTYCDPRLNNKQALEAAFLIAGYYREGKITPP